MRPFLLLVAAAALQPGLLSSVHPCRALAITMRIRTPRRKGVSSRASKANGLSIQGGYGRAAPRSGAGRQAAAEAGFGKYGQVQVLLLKDCTMGTAGDIVPMSLSHFKNAMERKGVGRIARSREVKQCATVQAMHAAVQVYDGTFSPATIAAFVSSPGSSGIYSRADGAVTPQQRAIESILAALGDGADTRTRAVEYWSKDTWQTMEAHRDVDEEASIAGGAAAARFPSRVVLIYGAIKAGLRAPTVLWCPGAADGAGGGALLAVPAVGGRMLVFEGSLLHAAPSPAELLGDEAGEESEVEGVDEGVEEGEEAEEEGEEVEEELERCVTVLNLWEDHAPALLGDDDEPGEGRGGEAGGGVEDSGEEMSCAPRCEWTSVDVGRSGVPSGNTRGAAALTPFAIYSFGADEPLESVVLASADVFREMLNEPQRPRWLPLVSAPPTLSVGVPNA